MSGHSSCHRMDAVFYFDAFSFQHGFQFTDGMLRLRNGQAVAGDDDYFL